MHQDDNGYLWFGTYDGLNLYNSKNILVYRFDLQIEESLCSNIIHKITPAGNNELWISTFLGLNKFSLTDRKVTESYPECLKQNFWDVINRVTHV
ncbi:two-component regulator propeller domain-containing protein [Marinilabilia salmonicolor]|uniref:two-component regulator propeller domain-containing protein n=1 Tax=Marinilabilia salmonicolor TaxID=989 RepID=UPI0006872C9E|nr:two-component regulator propeller domain-containing protein [Marinilabilia salmonicolor]